MQINKMQEHVWSLSTDIQSNGKHLYFLQRKNNVAKISIALVRVPLETVRLLSTIIEPTWAIWFYTPLRNMATITVKSVVEISTYFS